MTGTVDADAAVSLAFTAYESGRREASSAPERIRMQVAPGVPFDFVLHGEMTPLRLRRAAHLLEALASVLDEAEPQGASDDR